MATVSLITGGARSGKSRFAQQSAEAYPGERIFIATAQAFDKEMEDRIIRHRLEREDRFTTIEEPLDLGGALRGVPASARVVLVDCLTVWLGNLLHRHGNDGAAIADAVDSFTDALDAMRIDTIVVTNEVGMGIVPENALARQFRDIVGNINSKVAARADNVVLCVCGLPVAVKGSTTIGRHESVSPSS